jgi:anti-sigma factor RsiW
VSPRPGVRRNLPAPWALALAGSLLSAGCAPTVTVEVVNDSGRVLTGLRVAGVRDSTLVRELAPGGRITVAARVRGEDEIVLRGRVDGRPLRPAMATYVEPGYAVLMTVDGAGVVHTRARPRGT